MYTVSMSNQLKQSWQADPLPEANVVAALTSDFGSLLEIYTNATHLVEKYYINGEPSTVNGQKVALQNAIVTAYSNANNGNYENNQDNTNEP